MVAWGRESCADEAMQAQFEIGIDSDDELFAVADSALHDCHCVSSQ